MVALATVVLGTSVAGLAQLGGLLAYARGTRFELYREFAHPAPGCPRFCAIYEADAAATEERETRLAGRGTLSSGPPVWEEHGTVWRLVYRRIPPPE